MTVITEASNPDQMSCLRFNQGDRQADTPAPQTFILAYDNASEEMMNIADTFHEERAFSWVEMINRARYADDLLYCRPRF
eukprot:16131011-Heterocapsa_arctica.AAC.1